MEKISVIIPMYNSGDYIEQCLRSVMGQTYRELEILVVDDGSGDEGPGICRKLGLADDRIRLVRKKRGGVSQARNMGLDAALGEYIFFLDSDDAISPGLLEALLDVALKSGAKLAFCQYARVDNKQMETFLQSQAGFSGSTVWQKAEGEEVREWFHITHVNELAGIGGKLIRRDCIGSLRFDESLAKGEDTLFLYHLIQKQIVTAFLPQSWYYYRMHSQSVTHLAEVIGSRGFFESSRRIRDGEYERDHSASYALYWERMAAQQIVRSYHRMRKDGDWAGCRELEEIADTERRHPMYGRMQLSNRLLFFACFHCFPLYLLLDSLFCVLMGWRERRK